MRKYRTNLVKKKDLMGKNEENRISLVFNRIFWKKIKLPIDIKKSMTNADCDNSIKNKILRPLK